MEFLQHAADIVAIGADQRVPWLFLDGAAIHIKCTVDLHSTRLEGWSDRNRGYCRDTLP